MVRVMILISTLVLASLGHRGLDMLQMKTSQTARLLMGCQCFLIRTLCNHLCRIPIDNILRGPQSPIIPLSTMQIATSSVRPEDRWDIASEELRELNKWVTRFPFLPLHICLVEKKRAPV